MRQARVIPTRGPRRGTTLRPQPRAPIAAVCLTLVALLAPDLTLAPARPDAHANSASPAAAVTSGLPGLAARATPNFPTALAAARATAGADQVAFAVVRDGRVLWTGGSGEATPADTELVIGSVTKTFVAAAILELIEEDRLDLDGTIGELLPPYPGVPESITVRQLLDHTSGLADVYNQVTSDSLEIDPSRTWQPRSLFGTMQPPWHPPGAGWSYANANYYLLGLVVERVTGYRLQDELDRRFMLPLHLTSTEMLTATDPEPLTPAWATVFWASGAMRSSAADLARWGDALYAGDVLHDDTRGEMLSFNDHDYGLGAQRIGLAGRVGVGHTGLLDTYTALLLHLPDDGVTIALLVDRPEAPLGAMLTARPSGGGPSLLELSTGP